MNARKAEQDDVEAAREKRDKGAAEKQELAAEIWQAEKIRLQRDKIANIRKQK